MPSLRSWIALGTGVALAAASAQLGEPLRASSRPYRPLTASIARAEVIAAVRVTRAPVPGDSGPDGARVETSVVRTFKGSAAGSRLTLVLEPFERELTYRLVAGREYVLFLAPGSRPDAYRLVDPLVLPHDAATTARLDAAVPLVPAWSDASDGLASVIVPDHEPAISEGLDPFRYRSGEPVILWAGYRNVSDRDVALRYRDWPLEAHTCWHLRVERSGAGVVAPLPYPHVDRNQIWDFFSQNAHRFDMRLRPGEVFFLYVDRINVAEPGWGYRERLDFLYYPMTSPGEYTITAVGRFYHPGAPITSRPLTVWVD